jgi:hypothetical protein
MLTRSNRSHGFGSGWLILCIALGVHVADEAVTGFLSVYNPTVQAIRQQLPWFPMPVFTFDVWLTGLLAILAALAALTPLAFRDSRALRPFAYLFAAIMLMNAVGHTLGTVFGRTVASVQFERPMPGFYSSPLLLLASIHLLVQLRHSRR